MLAAVEHLLPRRRAALAFKASLDTGGEFRPPSDQATICRAANCEMRVFAERVSLCHSATLTRLTRDGCDDVL